MIASPDLAQMQTALLDGGVGEPERVMLRAGALTAQFEAGMLRYVRYGQVELVRGIYAAVRDQDWNTVPGDVRDLQIEQGADGFGISFISDHHWREVGYRWHGRITGAASGLTFHFSGEALTDFRRNRIGFCVLHPMAVAGLSLTIEHTDGAVEAGEFPRLIAPDLVFRDVRAIAHDDAHGLRCEVRMEGDTFETEDQRNWTDASFKTYCTPLDLPFPVEVKAGETVEQSITIALTAVETTVTTSDDPASITLTLLDTRLSVPLLGTVWRRPLSQYERRQLDRLHLAHLRADIYLSEPDALATLDAALADGVRVVALFLTDEYQRELSILHGWLATRKLPTLSWLILRRHAHAIPSEWVARAAEVVRPFGAVLSGTDAQFTELNRHRPDVAALDGVVYAVNPQVHAFDNATVMENALVQGETVRSARAFSGTTPIWVTPITFKPRWNVVATSPDAAALTEAMRVDPRQWSLFGAAWTLASLASLAAADEDYITEITYFEATGPLGLIAGDDRLHDGSGMSPLAHVLADVGEFDDDDLSVRMRPFASSAPASMVALCLELGDRQRLLLGNLTRQAQSVVLEGVGGDYAARYLSEDTVRQAMRDPVPYRQQRTELTLMSGSRITLPAYAVWTLDLI